MQTKRELEMTLVGLVTRIIAIIEIEQNEAAALKRIKNEVQAVHDSIRNQD